jgi:integration host factor subunit alpha
VTKAETGETVTRAEIADRLVQTVGLTRQDSVDLLERVLELITDELAKGETVKLVRFGNFVPLEKQPRVGRNPKTGVNAEISGRRVVTFRPSPMLKDLVNSRNA